MASILRDEPDLSKVPAQARRLLKRCLEKDPQKRLRHIGDVMALLDEPPSGEYGRRSDRAAATARAHETMAVAGASRRASSVLAAAQRLRLGAVALAERCGTGRALRGRRDGGDEVLLRRRDGRVARWPLDGVPGDRRRRRERATGCGRWTPSRLVHFRDRDCLRPGGVVGRQPVRVLHGSQRSATQESVTYRAGRLRRLRISADQ